MIKVGYLVSYDYNMLLTSVKQLYDNVDKIVVAIDSERKTWSGNAFEIPESFFEEINFFDINNKIEFYFDKFYLPHLSPIECESRERNLVLKKLGRGWKIQLDVDEYIYDFKKLAQYLNKYWYLNIFPKLTPICFRGELITLFRKLSDGYLYIDNAEKFPFITNQNLNTFTRQNDKIRNHFCGIKVIHQSWARTEEEIEMKIKNWGHRDDFNIVEYFDFWKNLDSKNYQEQQNFHPILPDVWDRLFFVSANSLDELIERFSIEKKTSLNELSKMKIFKSAIKTLIGRQY